MQAVSGDRPPTRLQQTGSCPPELEHPPCQRCQSINTKFCYYNNYNLSQPRYFCRSCRRYWTRRGTLRNVPARGGTQKTSTKRSRATPTSSSSSYRVTNVPMLSNQITIIPGIKSEMTLPFCGVVNLNDTAPGSFRSLLNTQGPGSLALGGFGVGLGTGAWPMQDASKADCNGTGDVAGDASSCNTWHIGGGESWLADGDCFG